MQPRRSPVTVLGETRGRAAPRPFGIKPADRLFHQYIVGQTGTGKSTLLKNMMQQDLRHRQGFALIDPHGDLAESLRAISGETSLYWNPSDPACPYGYNPVTPVSAAYRPLVASGLIEALKRQWSDSWGARMEHLLRHAVLALLEYPGATMADIMPLFLQKDVRAEVLSHVTDAAVQTFWRSEYGAMRYQTSVDGVAPIANKLGAFLAHPLVRRAVCDPALPLRFRTLMDEGRVLIVNLSKGRLGADTANILGGLIVANLSSAAYSRQDLPETDRRPYLLYVDEFASFTSDAFVGMLSELRKYRLGLVLATQYSAQADPALREAIFGNVGTQIAFRVGATDADIMTRQFGADVPSARDLVGLANYEMYLKLMIDGRQSKPFSARTRPPELEQ